MNNSLKKQRGMTATSIVLMLIGICSLVIMVLRIVPVYMNHGKVVSAIEGIKGTTDIQTASKAEVMKKLNDRFQINQVDRKDIGEKNIILTKHGDYVKLQITYQVEVPVISNISALMKFDDFVEAGTDSK
jgi:Domain of unknown function (DUF4845)